MGVSRFLLGLAACLLLAGPALGADDVDQQVRAMVRAARQMDYTGVLVHGMPGGVESMRFFHAGSADGTYRERLVMLTGPARELVRTGDSVRRYHPEAGRVVVGPRRGGTGIFRLDAGDLERVRAHYHVAQGPTGRVAGREARAIEFRAGDDQRFTYRIWRDEATDLPLQTEILNRDGRVQETFMFATVDPGIRPQDGELELHAPAGLPVVHRQRLARGRPPAILDALYLPPGFRLKARFQGPDAEGRHYFYSDGLATLSVFLDPAADHPDKSAEDREILQRGALRACSLSHGGYRVTVLGELPGRVLRRIANSLEDGTAEAGQ
ncbi:MAG TPA: MucB/RseB C-terminal domain-containing protein [Gammaproteobacteria bacterium]|nr:MucB/RseB C-terminal domain-containing protein [Gammaproteobacteria bacterium]